MVTLVGVGAVRVFVRIVLGVAVGWVLCRAWFALPVEDSSQRPNRGLFARLEMVQAVFVGKGYQKDSLRF